MKALIELIESLRKNIKEHSSSFSINETLTRYSLIDPVLNHLGWDLSNPDEMIPEFKILSMSCDYAFFKQNSKKPFLIIEAKSLDSILIDKKQIGNYIGNSTARFAIFTDGAKWKIFDFKIHSEEDPNERIVLEIDINSNEGTFLLAMKFLCLSKENLMADIPFFLIQKVQTFSIQPKLIPNSHLPQNDKIQPPITNQGNLISLYDLNSKKLISEKPIALQIDGVDYKVKSWSEVSIAFVDWLITTKKLTIDQLPILNSAEKDKYFINSAEQHKNPEKNAIWKPVQGFYVDVKYNADCHIKNILYTLDKLGLSNFKDLIKISVTIKK